MQALGVRAPVGPSLPPAGTAQPALPGACAAMPCATTGSHAPRDQPAVPQRVLTLLSRSLQSRREQPRHAAKADERAFTATYAQAVKSLQRHSTTLGRDSSAQSEVPAAIATMLTDPAIVNFIWRITSEQPVP